MIEPTFYEYLVEHAFLTFVLIIDTPLPLISTLLIYHLTLKTDVYPLIRFSIPVTFTVVSFSLFPLPQKIIFLLLNSNCCAFAHFTVSLDAFEVYHSLFIT